MKKITTITMVLVGLFGYGQESLFTDLNKKGFGTFNASAQYFWMHRTDIVDNSNSNYNKHDNSSSLAFTLNYQSPAYRNFYVNLSYVGAYQFQEYIYNPFQLSSNDFSFGAQSVQNDSFSFLNNLSLNYSLDHLGIKKGVVTVGTFPLDMEFMTRYPIRQKEQAYQGIYVDIPNIGNWNFKAGYIDAFSSWTTNRNAINFLGVTLAYNGQDYKSDGNIFLETSYKNAEKAQFFSTYYTKFHDLEFLLPSENSLPIPGSNISLDVLGFSYLQQVISFNETMKLSLRAKGTYQWGPLGEVYAIQPGLLFTQNTFSIETGFFSVEGDMEIQNPFAAKWIIAEPLWEIDFQREENSETFYIESLYRLNNWKIYALFMRTTNSDPNASYRVMQESNIIATCQLKNRWNAGVKLAFFRGDRPSLAERHLLDARLVLNYSF